LRKIAVTEISTQLDLLATFVENDEFLVARRLARKIEPLFHNGGIENDEARFYFLSGRIKAVLADPDEKQSFNRALMVHGATPSILAETYNKLAEIAIGERSFLEADSLIRQGLSCTFEPVSLYEACQFNLRSTAINRFLAIGDIEEAVRSLESTVRDFEKASTHVRETCILILLRTVFDVEVARRNSLSAMLALRKAAEICLEKGMHSSLMYAAILADLALSARSECNPAQSLEYLQQSLRITRRKVGFASVSSTYLLKDLADTFAVLGNRDKSQAAYQTILKIERRTGRNILTQYVESVLSEGLFEL
jgi:tetratricopeptide (TPR) repeat protein